MFSSTESLTSSKESLPQWDNGSVPLIFLNEETTFLFNCLPLVSVLHPLVWRTLSGKWEAATIPIKVEDNNAHQSSSRHVIIFETKLFFPSGRMTTVVPNDKKSLRENGFALNTVYDSHRFLNYTKSVQDVDENRFMTSKIEWNHEPYFLTKKKHMLLYDSCVACHQDKVSEVRLSALKSSLTFKVFPNVFLINLEQRNTMPKYSWKTASYCNFARKESPQSILQWEQAIDLGPHLFPVDQSL